MSFILILCLFYVKIAIAQIAPIDLTQIFNQSEIQQTISKFPANQCQKQLLKVQDGLMNNEMWALKMIDSFAKPQSGIYMGNIMHVGNFDECLEIEEVQGKYCTVSYEPRGLDDSMNTSSVNLEVKKTQTDFLTTLVMSYGICVPNDCTAKDLQHFLDDLLIGINLPVNVKFQDEFCFREGKPFSNLTIIAIFFALLLVFGTIYDVFIYRKLPEFEQKPNALVAFSMYRNTKIIFDTSKSSPQTIKCLDGIRVLSMMWIILGHEFQYSIFQPQINMAAKTDWVKKRENAFFFAATVSVDTFFLISGLLVVYVVCMQRSRGLKFPLLPFYIHRILRLTPSLIMAVLFTATLLTYMGSGPAWFLIEEIFQKPCENNWWATVTYIQNYVHSDEQCMGVAWYLACDTQMYFLSPAILFPLFKWPKKTIAALGVLVILNGAFVFQATYRNQFGSIFSNMGQEGLQSIFYPTHVRASGYLIGMILGYYLSKTKTDTPIKLSKNKVTLLWLTSVLVMIGIIFAHHEMVFEYNVLASSFFNALVRIGWCLSLSVIIFLCANGYGGKINAFFSSNVFTVLYRLNYAAYLLHFNVLGVLKAQTRTPTYFSNLVHLHEFWGHYVFTLGVSFLWCSAFEIPVVMLEKIIFASKAKNVQKIQMDEKEDLTQDVANGNQKIP